MSDQFDYTDDGSDSTQTTDPSGYQTLNMGTAPPPWAIPPGGSFGPTMITE